MRPWNLCSPTRGGNTNAPFRLRPSFSLCLSSSALFLPSWANEVRRRRLTDWYKYGGFSVKQTKLNVGKFTHETKNQHHYYPLRNLIARRPQRARGPYSILKLQHHDV